MRSYLKELRKKAGLTQSDVAKKIGVGVSTYTMIELGERQKDLNLSLAEKLASLFEIPISQIDFDLEVKNEKCGIVGGRKWK